MVENGTLRKKQQILPWEREHEEYDSHFTGYNNSQSSCMLNGNENKFGETKIK